MRRPALVASFFAFAPLASAITLDLDPTFSVERPKQGVKSLDITGTLTTGAAIGSASLIYTPATLSSTERIVGAEINGGLLSGLAGGSFTGVLFTLTVPWNSAVGTYLGAAQFRVKIGRQSYLSNLSSFNVVVKDPPAPTPEPGVVVALGAGMAGFFRRKR